MANGTFLWVSLVFHQAGRDNCLANEILEFVRKMPSYLNKMYEHMICQIIEQTQKPQITAKIGLSQEYRSTVRRGN
ncbi:hypothetical protein N7508_003849 [Penicillium antarcticum]|uniref:uncharacterized protein n=1 Tax=Penicillium antarcticum TaxID=416450 RepID=UPI002390F7F4|nr:uncharacterized protein N7508_003849 [Penicillium antarcticum]KAJ5313019.1 hypothetical protein N7508_003849 [Penicillium antarcticum]